MFRRTLTRLGFMLATVLWTLMLYGALSVSLGPKVGAPTLIGLVLLLVIAVAIVARLMLGRVF